MLCRRLCILKALVTAKGRALVGLSTAENAHDDLPALVLVCRCCQVEHHLHCNHSQRLLKWRCQIYSSSCKTTLTCINISVQYQDHISEIITFNMLVQMLPSQVPSPLQSFTEAEIAQVELPDMQQQLRDNTAMVQGAYKQLSAEATGGASLEDFAWAVSVSASVAAVCAAVHAYTARWALSSSAVMYLPLQYCLCSCLHLQCVTKLMILTFHPAQYQPVRTARLSSLILELFTKLHYCGHTSLSVLWYMPVYRQVCLCCGTCLCTDKSVCAFVHACVQTSLSVLLYMPAYRQVCLCCCTCLCNCLNLN